MFNPGLSIGQILKNSDIVDTFKCGNMGGISLRTDKIASVILKFCQINKPPKIQRF